MAQISEETLTVWVWHEWWLTLLGRWAGRHKRQYAGERYRYRDECRFNYSVLLFKRHYIVVWRHIS